MSRLGLVNAYGVGGFVLTMPLFDFLHATTPAIKAADDAPPSGKPPSRLVYPSPIQRLTYVPCDRYTAPAFGTVPAVGWTRPGKY